MRLDYLKKLLKLFHVVGIDQMQIMNLEGHLKAFG